MTDVLYGGPLDPWNSIVRSQVTERARQVVSSQLEGAKEATMQMVDKLAADINTDPKWVLVSSVVSLIFTYLPSSDLSLLFPGMVTWYLILPSLKGSTISELSYFLFFVQNIKNNEG